MKLNIGDINSDYYGFDRIAGIAVKTKGVSHVPVELDLSSCSFFAANMAAPLYAVIARLRDELNDVSMTNMRSGVKEILQKNKFLSLFNQPDLNDTHQTTLPFKIFKLGAESQFNDYLNIYMKGRGISTISDALTKRFMQSLFEIFINATIHSKSGSGVFVCGQFYPNRQRLDFTIADAGVGIWENVKQYTKNLELDSCGAIEWAMTEGNTTKTGRQPGGLGLKLIKDFIKRNEGTIKIVSRFGYYNFSQKGERLIKMGNDFPGTCINIEINTNDASSYCLASELKSEDIF